MMQQLHETHNSSANENGVEEVVCSLRVKHNADNPEDADIYVRDGGRMNIVNRFKLPVLKYLGLGAERVFLRPVSNIVTSYKSDSVVYIHNIMLMYMSMVAAESIDCSFVEDERTWYNVCDERGGKN